MEAIVLSGGFGTRLKPLVKNVPKPMAIINKRPFLEILLNSLATKGFERVILSLHYKPEKIKEHFNYSFKGMILDYVIEESPLGTGGAIKKSFKKVKSDQVYVFNGDSYLDFNIDFTESFRQKIKSPIILLKELDNVGRYGEVKIKDNLIIGFQEKKNSGPGLINAGVYILNKNILRDYPENYKFSFEKDYLAVKVCKSPHYYFISDGFFIDIGIPEDLLIAREKFK